MIPSPANATQEPPQLALAYEPSRRRRRNRNFRRWAVWLAILIAAQQLCTLLPPLWRRIQFYRVQEQLAASPSLPATILVRQSPSVPYKRVPGPSDQVFATFWSRRQVCELSAFTGVNSAGTPLFCGVLRTAQGRKRIVQAFANIISPAGSGEARAVITLVYCQRYAPTWLIWPSAKPPVDTEDDVDVGKFDFAAGASDDLSVWRGNINATNPAELDIPIVLNGKRKLLQLRMVDLPTPRRGVAFSIPNDFASFLLSTHHMWGASGFW